MSTATTPVYDQSEIHDAEYVEVDEPSIPIKTHEISLAESVLQRQHDIERDRKRAIDEELAKMEKSQAILAALGWFGQETAKRKPVPQPIPTASASTAAPVLPQALRGVSNVRTSKPAKAGGDNRSKPDTERTCPLCQVIGHSLRAHKFQGDSKKKFSGNQLARLRAGESPNLDA
jgi:hypothetical protein